ncbi:MAG: hypothetical protein ABF697_07325 [Zymomonas mobilis]|uniref:hypothetical protein n=1 Tax=Zymomonas mobilis TaxID=542 RepID=UPI0039EB2BE9
MKTREEAVRLSNLYNDSFGAAPAKRETYLRQLLKKIGKNAYFEPRFRCEFGSNISIGDNSYAHFDYIILDGAKSPSGIRE